MTRSIIGLMITVSTHLGLREMERYLTMDSGETYKHANMYISIHGDDELQIMKMETLFICIHMESHLPRHRIESLPSHVVSNCLDQNYAKQSSKFYLSFV